MTLLIRPVTVRDAHLKRVHPRRQIDRTTERPRDEAYIDAGIDQVEPVGDIRQVDILPRPIVDAVAVTGATIAIAKRIEPNPPRIATTFSDSKVIRRRAGIAVIIARVVRMPITIGNARLARREEVLCDFIVMVPRTGALRFNESRCIIIFSFDPDRLVRLGRH